MRKCNRCHSVNIVKNGTHPRWKQGKLRRVQYYICNNCGKQFPEK